MGCDIHLAVEVRRNGRWEVALPPESARDPYLVEQAAKHPDHPWYAARHKQVWYDDRNYRVFAVLADVRNSGDITPIDEPRDLPDDVSDTVRRWASDERGDNDMDLGDHSFSWLTLAELQAYPWEGEAAESGVVTLGQFVERVQAFGADFPVRVTRRPYQTWSGDIFGPNIVVRSADSVLAAIRQGGFAAPISECTHVRDTWVAHISVSAGAFTERLMPEIAKLGSPDDVRIVFGFDS